MIYQISGVDVPDTWLSSYLLQFVVYRGQIAIG